MLAGCMPGKRFGPATPEQGRAALVEPRTRTELRASTQQRKACLGLARVKQRSKLPASKMLDFPNWPERWCLARRERPPLRQAPSASSPILPLTVATASATPSNLNENRPACPLKIRQRDQKMMPERVPSAGLGQAYGRFRPPARDEICGAVGADCMLKS